MIPASSILRMRSATAGAERFTRCPNSLYERRAFSCNSSRSRQPVSSSSFSISKVIVRFSHRFLSLLWQTLCFSSPFYHNRTVYCEHRKNRRIGKDHKEDQMGTILVLL